MTITKKHILTTIFILSVALNIFVITSIAYIQYKFESFSYMGGNQADWIDSRMQRGEDLFIRNLDGADKQIARTAFSKARPVMRDAFLDIRTHQAAIIDLMAQDNVDQAALDASITASTQAAQNINESFHVLFRDMATQLSPEARQKIAGHLSHLGKRHDAYEDE